MQMYAALVEDFNHTCVYLIKANSELEARAKVWTELNLDNNKPHEGLPENCFCFDVHSVEIKDIDVLQPIFCSSDHIWGIKSTDIDQYIIDKYSQLALICGESGRHQEALELYNKLAMINPAGGYEYVIGEAYEKLGQYDKAIKSYSQLLEIENRKNGNDGEYDSMSKDAALSSLGRVYEVSNDVPNALEYYKRWVTLQKFDEFGMDNLSEQEKHILDFIAANSG